MFSSPLRLSIHPSRKQDTNGKQQFNPPSTPLFNLTCLTGQPQTLNTQSPSLSFFFHLGQRIPPSNPPHKILLHYNNIIKRQLPTAPRIHRLPAMESVASSSSHAHPYHHSPRPPSQPVADRILRAVHHHLLLLHRSDPDFFVLGATGNVYTVSLSASPSCTCPDRTTPCKHILFVLIRVLGVPLDDPCLRRRTLRPCRLRHLLSTTSACESLASASLRARFHERFFLARKRGGSGRDWEARQDERAGEEDGDEAEACPICLEEMGAAGGEGGRVVACTTCRNRVHEECLLRWKKSLGRRSAICVMCRARWRKEREPDRYVNLAAYVGEDLGRSRVAVGDDGESICGD